MAHSRYKDLGIFLNSFADEVEVFCPKCQKPGKVLAAWKPYHWSGRFCCIHCSFVAEIEQSHWFGPVVLYWEDSLWLLWTPMAHRKRTLCEHVIVYFFRSTESLP